jgi:hypothetical protein
VIAQAENRTTLKDSDGRQLIIPEQSTLRTTMTLLDELGAAVPLSSITTATLTIYARDEPSQPLVNSVDHVDIKNTGRGTIHATSGLLTLVLTPLDNSIQNIANDLEWHRFLIEIGYAGTQKLKYEIEAPVRNLVKVT